MDSSVKVAVVRGDRRRGAVAEALSLITDDLRQRVRSDPNPVLIPNLDSHRRPWVSTSFDTLSATIDTLLSVGATSATIMSGTHRSATSASDCFQRLGYKAEFWGRPVAFTDIDVDPIEWSTIHTFASGSEPISFRVPSLALMSGCRVSLTVPRTNGVSRVALGLSNLANILHRRDRHLLAPWGGAEDSNPVRQILNGDHVAARLVTQLRGWLTRAWWGVRSVNGGMRLTSSERNRLAAIDRMMNRLVAVIKYVIPHIIIIDGFRGMQGEGPWHGSPVASRTVIAGTDAVAVDAVAAAMMGFEPLGIPYLRRAHALKLGIADLEAITVVGESLNQVRRRFRKHSSDRLIRLLGGAEPNQGMPPRPHFEFLTARQQVRDQA